MKELPHSHLFMALLLLDCEPEVSNPITAVAVPVPGSAWLV